MQIKEMPPMTVLCLETETTLETMPPYVREIPKRLHREVQRLKLRVTGPDYWIYAPIDSNLRQTFTLQIALPVDEVNGIPDGFFFRHLRPFKCLTDLHHGSWDTLAATYERLRQAVHSNGYTCSGICREMYMHIDFVYPENHLTEVQIGIL